MGSVNGDKKTKIIGNYKIGKVLGTGSYGYVRLGVNTITNEQFAIKTLKDQQNKKGIQREISILKLLDHPNIVRLYDVIEDPKSGSFYLVLELASGGELFDYIVARGKLKEKEARKFFRQIISGVEYCHSNLVIHRDLKPENLLLDSEGNIKINDFGFSNVMTPGERFSTFCGSVSYVAPEIIKNIKYIGPEIDIWSLGVILYTLVCGRLPWPETVDGSPAINNIIDGDYDKTPLLNLSASCQDLIAQVLIPDPHKRTTLQEIRHHPWVNEGYSGPPPCLVQSFEPVVNINTEILDQIVNIGFDETEARKNILANAHCQEVTMYHLMLHKWNLKEQAANRKEGPLSEASVFDDLPATRTTRSGSMPAVPSKEPVSPDEIRATGAAARWHKNNKRASHRTSAHYTGGGEGRTQLAALVQAISDTSNESTSSSSSPADSPIATATALHAPSNNNQASTNASSNNSQANTNANASTAAAKRNTMEPHGYRNMHHEPGSTSRPILGSGSPPSPMRSPAQSHNHQAATKRRSLILTGLESAFKSLMKEKEKEPKPKDPETPPPVVENRRRSSTIVGIESAWRSLVGTDKVKQVSGVFNVDTTTTQSPQQVMEEIIRVLDIEAADGGDFKLEYKIRGHLFKISYPSRKMKFQMEICRIKNLDLTGVKLKRVKGDIWVYKEYCQRLMTKLKL